MKNSLDQVCCSSALSFFLATCISDCQATDQAATGQPPYIKWAQRWGEYEPTLLDLNRPLGQQVNFSLITLPKGKPPTNAGKVLGPSHGKEKVMTYHQSESFMESYTQLLKSRSFFIPNFIDQDNHCNHLAFQEDFKQRVQSLTKRILSKQKERQYLARFPTDNFFTFGDEMKSSVEQVDADIANLKVRLSKVIKSAKVIAFCPLEPNPVRSKRENQIYGHLYTLQTPDT